MATSTLGSGTLVLAGTTSGTTTVTATAVAGTTTLTLPAATDTLVGKATTDTLTNKTLTGAAMNGTLGATTASTANVTTLTTSSTVTHNGGTANGVPYLNGSKVLTTGSALVFDGTDLTVPSKIYAGQYQGDGTNDFVVMSNNASKPIVFYTGVGGVSAVERARIDSSGNLLVGTTTASGKIGIEYDGGVVIGQNLNDSANTTNSTLMQFLIQGTQAGSIKRVGATSAVVYNTTSDYRLKTVVGAVTGQGERIDALKPIDYQWKEGNTLARGFLAHEFQEVYPSSVSGDKDDVDTNNKPMYQAMQASTSEVMADLVAEIQSLRKRLAALESA